MEELKRVTVAGGHTAVATKLKDLGWDGSSIVTTVQHRLGAAGNIASTNWLALGSLQHFTVYGTDIWPGADKKLKVTFKVDNLGMFTFRALKNISDWVRLGEILPTFTMGSRTAKRTVTTVEAMHLGAGDLSCRIHIIPSSTTEAKVWFSVAPMSVQDLEEQLLGKHTSNSVPTITFHVHKDQRERAKGKAAKAVLGVAEVGDTIGLGALAFIDNTMVEEEAPDLDIQLYKEASVQAYRGVLSNLSVSANDFAQEFGKYKTGKPTIPPV